MICFLCIIGFCVLAFVSIAMYFRFGWFKHIYHDLFEWHVPNDKPERFDGMSFHAECKWCGKKITQDSQGNWY